MYVSDQMTTRLLSKLVNPAETPRTPSEVLSDREFEVFRMIADGLGPTEIAKRLSVSVKTVQTHREHIKEKLSLKTASELNRFAMRWSMPPLP
jgi:DNA-binding NarL/FixJ family response regulator